MKVLVRGRRDGRTPVSGARGGATPARDATRLPSRVHGQRPRSRGAAGSAARIPAARDSRQRIPAHGTRWAGCVSCWSFVGGLVAALALLRRWRPDVVLATGGYASLAAGLAAALLRRPLVVQEQNSIPGLTNRWLGRLAREVHVAFPGLRALRFGRAVHCTGNPLRADAAAGRAAGGRASRRAAGARRRRQSRGALDQRAVGGAIPLVAASRRVVWLWQTGELDYAATRAALAGRAGRARCAPTSTTWRRRSQSATLLVCRAGAMTIAEITALGKAAILIPFPGAVDDHQTANARVLVEAGAAVSAARSRLDGRALGARGRGAARGSGALRGDERGEPALRAAACHRRTGGGTDPRWRGQREGRRMFGRVSKVHFVGIGGIGMSGIAEVLLNLGYAVSGSDVKASAVTRRLEPLGARIAIGHAAGESRRCRRRGVFVGGAVRTTPSWSRRATSRFRSSRAPRCWPS